MRAILRQLGPAASYLCHLPPPLHQGTWRACMHCMRTLRYMRSFTHTLTHSLTHSLKFAHFGHCSQLLHCSARITKREKVKREQREKGEKEKGRGKKKTRITDRRETDRLEWPCHRRRRRRRRPPSAPLIRLPVCRNHGFSSSAPAARYACKKGPTDWPPARAFSRVPWRQGRPLTTGHQRTVRAVHDSC